MAASRARRGSSHGELIDIGARGSQETVQLVHRAVGFDTHPVLGYALAADEAGLAAVAFARVDAIDGEAGLVKVLRKAAFHCYRPQLAHCALAMVHFMPATKFSFGDGNPNTSSYWRFSALRRLP